jgi:hypothetical protein
VATGACGIHGSVRRHGQAAQISRGFDGLWSAGSASQSSATTGLTNGVTAPSVLTL